jgi:YHS domain-containing protein
VITRYLQTLVLIIFVGAVGASSVNAADAVAPINTEQGVALKGYDPVAYFEQKQAVQGAPAFKATWNGVTYFFASAAHRDVFNAAPERYAPQYGGYCSYAMSKNLIADINPQAWAVVDGKLYLNNNKVAHALWSLDIHGNVEKADHNWPQYPKHTEAAAQSESAMPNN